MIPPLSRVLLLVTSACALVAAPSARAGDFYLGTKLGISGGMGSSSGSTEFFENTGDDSDSSPVYGGILGFDLSLRELFRQADRIDQRWSVRHEIEGLAGRDYEFVTEGADRYLSDVTSWGFLYNVWFDAPVQPALAGLFGRIPILDPLTIFLGAGLGLGVTDVKVSDNVSNGKETAFNFAWQAGGGISYELTDRVSLDVGYRYYDMGPAKVDLSLGPNPFGDLRLDLTSHEIQTGLRIRFYSLGTGAR